MLVYDTLCMYYQDVVSHQHKHRCSPPWPHTDSVAEDTSNVIFFPCFSCVQPLFWGEEVLLHAHTETYMYICVQSRCIVDSQNVGEIPKCVLFCNYKKKCDSGVHVCVLCVCV